MFLQITVYALCSNDRENLIKLKMSQLPVKDVSISRPRNQFNDRNLANALDCHFTPCVINDVHVISVRCVFDFISSAEAVKHLAARRRLMEKRLLESEEVIHVLFIFRNNLPFLFSLSIFWIILVQILSVFSMIPFLCNYILFYF